MFIKLMKHKRENNFSKFADPLTLQPQQVSNFAKVQTMLTKQERAIDTLLQKYNDDILFPQKSSTHKQSFDIGTLSNSNVYESMKPISQTLEAESPSSIRLKLLLGKDQKINKNHPSERSRAESSFRAEYGHLSERAYKGSQTISLPAISQNKRLQKSRKSPRNDILYHFKKEKQKMEHKLYKIYGQKSRQPMNQIYSEPGGQLKKKKSKKRKHHKRQGQKEQLSQISAKFSQIEEVEPEQLSLKDKNANLQLIQSDDDTEQQDVFTNQYTKQFRGLMKGQCLEELNFLYFSRNEQMKDWTDSLLSMIQKHDKEVTGLRRKSKYLKTFDQKFFTIGIYNIDDL